jgi:hypothetical protein
MLGAGLIKIRGDECRRDLTCLVHNHETQPIPDPLGRALRFMRVWFHKPGVLVKHATEPAAPRALAAAVALISVAPVRNRIASGQVMNAASDRLHQVDAYGVFGIVGRERAEIVFEGTGDAAISPETRRRPYNSGASPGTRGGAPASSPRTPTGSTGRPGSPRCRARSGTPGRSTWRGSSSTTTPGRRASSRATRSPARLRATSAPFSTGARSPRPAIRRAPGGRGGLLGRWLPPLSADDPRPRRFLEARGWPGAGRPETGGALERGSLPPGLAAP